MYWVFLVKLFWINPLSSDGQKLLLIHLELLHDFKKISIKISKATYELEHNQSILKIRNELMQFLDYIPVKDTLLRYLDELKKTELSY